MHATVLSAIRSEGIDDAGDILKPGLVQPPFSLVVRDAIVFLVRRIIQAEKTRGEITRAERSTLCTKAQLYQNLIDRLFYTMAGLMDEEAMGLEERLAKML